MADRVLNQQNEAAVKICRRVDTERVGTYEEAN